MCIFKKDEVQHIPPGEIWYYRYEEAVFDYRALKERMKQQGAAYAQMLEVLKEVQECSEYWSEYFVPVGIHERIANAIKVAEASEDEEV